MSEELKTNGLPAWFASAGYSTKVGLGYKTLLLQYFSAKLNIKASVIKATFNNH
ncbi:MAG: hypothetical protein M1818_007372 [Claussenomyces sp. TS43310]|nr:MAG: hypothetical protein M1818_007372 [Claussenomyces sp. TS43310]